MDSETKRPEMLGHFTLARGVRAGQSNDEARCAQGVLGGSSGSGLFCGALSGAPSAGGAGGGGGGVGGGVVIVIRPGVFGALGGLITCGIPPGTAGKAGL